MKRKPTKPTLNLDEHPLDEWRVMMAGSEDKVPITWWEKSMSEKRKWLEKKFKHESRHTHVDIEYEKARDAKLRLLRKINVKERAKMADVYAKLGL